MSQPTLYGISGSRAIRSIWAMEEVGAAYTHVPTHFIKDSKAPEYLAVNPNGRIPSLVDGELTLCESMAINLYAAEKWGKGLYPVGLEERAQVHQWSVWGISEIEPLQMRIVVQKFFTPEEKRNAKVVAVAEKDLERPFGVLDAHLADRAYLLGDSFSIADLNVAGVMLLLQLIEFDYSAFANVKRWADACYARPSLAAAQARD
ncbi:MAG: glutathione S-transferase family protein [Myxococcota bacterium]